MCPLGNTILRFWCTEIQSHIKSSKSFSEIPFIIFLIFSLHFFFFFHPIWRNILRECSSPQVMYLIDTLHWMKLQFISLDLDQEKEDLCVRWHSILSAPLTLEFHHTWGDSFLEMTVESLPFCRKMRQEAGNPDFQWWQIVLEAKAEYCV